MRPRPPATGGGAPPAATRGAGEVWGRRSPRQTGVATAVIQIPALVFSLLFREFSGAPTQTLATGSLKLGWNFGICAFDAVAGECAEQVIIVLQKVCRKMCGRRALKGQTRAVS